jgi:hypothetical protein
MARKTGKQVEIKQESVRAPDSFDYEVRVVPFKDRRGNNRLDLKGPSGKLVKELHVYASEGNGKRRVVGWKVDTSQVPGETPAKLQISFPIGTPFSYILGPIEIDDASRTAVNVIWKRIKRRGNVQHGLKFYYSLALDTQDGNGGTHHYVAELDDPMVIVDAGP